MDKSVVDGRERIKGGEGQAAVDEVESRASVDDEERSRRLILGAASHLGDPSRAKALRQCNPGAPRVDHSRLAGQASPKAANYNLALPTFL
jgi:hypothetical protein